MLLFYPVDQWNFVQISDKKKLWLIDTITQIIQP